MRINVAKIPRIALCAAGCLLVMGFLLFTGESDWLGFPVHKDELMKEMAMKAEYTAATGSDPLEILWMKREDFMARYQKEDTTDNAEQAPPNAFVTLSSRQKWSRPKPVAARGLDGENAGSFRITVYTPYCDGGIWGYKTATGVTSSHLRTCAVDQSVIPLGSVIELGGLELLAVDTGSAVRGRVIDVFFDGSVAEAYNWIASFGTRHEVEVVG